MDEVWAQCSRRVKEIRYNLERTFYHFHCFLPPSALHAHIQMPQLWPILRRSWCEPYSFLASDVARRGIYWVLYKRKLHVALIPRKNGFSGFMNIPMQLSMKRETLAHPLRRIRHKLCIAYRELPDEGNRGQTPIKTIDWFSAASLENG